MSNLDTKHLLVKHFQSLKEYEDSEEKINDFEIIEIDLFDQEEIDLALNDNFFIMPNYITYKREAKKKKEVIEELSKNKKKKIKKAIKEVQLEENKFKIFIESPVSQKTFNKWFELYKKNLDKKEIGIILLKENWPISQLDKCIKLGIFIEQNNELKGGILGRTFDKNTWIDKRFSISYSTLNDDLKSLGINEYLNLELIQELKNLNIDIIVRGKDTNLYGKHLSSGIPIFKTSLGYEIIPYKGEDDILIKFNNISEFNDPIFFVSYTNSKKQLLQGNIITNNCDENFSQFLLKGLQKLNVYTFENKSLKLISTINQK